MAWAQTAGPARTHAQVSRAAAWNVAEFAGRVYCGAGDLALAAQWIMWMNIVDDRVETLSEPEIAAALAPITNVLAQDDPAAGRGAGPFAESFADLWQRTRTGMPDEWRSRVAGIWTRCADSMGWEAANRRAGRAPLLDDYIANRATAGATYLALILTEGLGTACLPAELYYAGPLSALRGLAADHICWANDLLSLEREEQRGDVHNLVLVLERTYDHDRPTALAEATRMTNERMYAIRLLADRIRDYEDAVGLPDDHRRRLDRSVDDLLAWVAGSLQFHTLSTRHVDHRSGPENPFSAAYPEGETDPFR
ncbi:terpene synthase family protein [Nocardia sp. N2S4-5]|uniref:terpene synthase family protein n=1 Tax=Nocardia sp. N2S4-5 TaxID=3351565 RepID=UPI0037D9633F